MTIGHTHVTLPLPCIVYSESKGLKFFSSSNFKNEHHEEVPYQGLVLSHGKIHAENGEPIYDISITKNVASLLISAVLLLSIFIGIGKKYQDNPHRAPKGIQSLLSQSLSLFVMKLLSQILERNIFVGLCLIY